MRALSPPLRLVAALSLATWACGMPEGRIDDDGDGFIRRPPSCEGAPSDTAACEEAFDCDDGDAAVSPGASELCPPAGQGVDEDCDGQIDEGPCPTSTPTGSEAPPPTPTSPTPSPTTEGTRSPVPTPTVPTPTATHAPTPSAPAPSTSPPTTSPTPTAPADPSPSVTAPRLTPTQTPTTATATQAMTPTSPPTAAPTPTSADRDEDGHDRATDCDDTDATVYPGAVEFCDGIDDDCDQQTDEGVQLTFFIDADTDGHGAPGTGAPSCGGDGLSAEGDDCDDHAAAVYPGAPERLDGVDDDCDGCVDEGRIGPGVLRLNEVQPQPWENPDSAYEYVEIRNETSFTVDLSAYTLTADAGDGAGPRTLQGFQEIAGPNGSVLIPPGGLKVIAQSVFLPGAAMDLYVHVASEGVYALGPRETLELTWSCGDAQALVDRLSYDLDDFPGGPAGAAVQLDPLATPGSGLATAEDLCLASSVYSTQDGGAGVGRGTPGELNDPCPP